MIFATGGALLLGTAWTNVEGMLQVTAYTGVFGLSLVTALAAAAPAAERQGPPIEPRN